MKRFNLLILLCAAVLFFAGPALAQDTRNKKAQCDGKKPVACPVTGNTEGTCPAAAGKNCDGKKPEVCPVTGKTGKCTGAAKGTPAVFTTKKIAGKDCSGTCPSKSTAKARMAAGNQTLCPVSGEKVNKAVFVDFNGKRIYFRCNGCKSAFLKSPERYAVKLKAMEAKGVVFASLPATQKAPKIRLLENAAAPSKGKVLPSALKNASQAECSKDGKACSGEKAALPKVRNVSNEQVQKIQKLKEGQQKSCCGSCGGKK